MIRLLLWESMFGTCFMPTPKLWVLSLKPKTSLKMASLGKEALETLPSGIVTWLPSALYVLMFLMCTSTTLLWELLMFVNCIPIASPSSTLNYLKTSLMKSTILISTLTPTLKIYTFIWSETHKWLLNYQGWFLMDFEA